MKYRFIIIIIIILNFLTDSLLSESIIGTIRSVNTMNGEIIISKGSTAVIMNMHDRVYVEVSGKRIVMKVVFPMLTIAKCELISNHKKSIKDLSIGNNVFKLVSLDNTKENRVNFSQALTLSIINDTEGLSKVIKDGYNINLKDKTGRTILHYVSGLSNTDTIKEILKSKPNINIQENNMGWTPLMIAIVSGNIEHVGLLLKQKPNLSLRDKTGATALRMAEDAGRSDIAEMLIEQALK